MAANGTPQSELYSGYGSMSNPYRDRSAEQSSTNSGNPMSYIPNYFDPTYGTQQPGLGRYVPPMISTNGNPLNGNGGYAYNLPTSFGPYGGAWGSPFSQQGPQSQQGIQQAGQMGYGNGYPQGGMPQQQMPTPGMPTYNNGYPVGGQPQQQGQAPVPNINPSMGPPGPNSNGLSRLGDSFSGYGNTSMPQIGYQTPGGNNQQVNYGGQAPVPQYSTGQGPSAWQSAHDQQMANDPAYANAVAANAASRAAWWARQNGQGGGNPQPTPVNS